VFLFHRANPRWKSDHIIFVKSNLDILPDYRQRKAEQASEELAKAETLENAPLATTTLSQPLDDLDGPSEDSPVNKEKHDPKSANR